MLIYEHVFPKLSIFRCIASELITKLNYAYIFKTVLRMSISRSMLESSKYCNRKLFFLKAVPHSGHAAEPRINSSSTQLSHLE